MHCPQELSGDVCDLIVLLWLNKRRLKIHMQIRIRTSRQWLESVVVMCAVGERKRVETEGISAGAVLVMRGAVALERFSLRAVRATCCGHVFVFLCGMVVCGHCSVCLFMWPVFVVHWLFFRSDIFRLDQTSYCFLTLSLL